MLREQLGRWFRSGTPGRLSWAERIAVLLAAALLTAGVVSGAAELHCQGRAREILSQTKAARLACSAVAAQCAAQGRPFADQNGPGGFAPGVQEEIQQLGALPGTVQLLRTDGSGTRVLAMLYQEDGFAASYDESDGWRVWRCEQRIYWPLS